MAYVSNDIFFTIYGLNNLEDLMPHKLWKNCSITWYAHRKNCKFSV